MAFLLFTSSRSCLHADLILNLLSITSVWYTRCLGWLICVNINVCDNFCWISLITINNHLLGAGLPGFTLKKIRVILIDSYTWWALKRGLCCSAQNWVWSLILPSNLDVFSFDLAHYEWKDQLQNSDAVLNLESETCQRSGTFRDRSEV